MNQSLTNTAASVQDMTPEAILTKILSEAQRRLDEAPDPNPVSYFKSPAYHEKLLEKAAYYNTVPGNLKYYNCTKCNNKGVIEYITDEWDESCKVCECMKIRACYSAMNRSGITEEMIRSFSFDKYSEMEEFQTQMKAAAKRYATSDLTHWLFFGGQSGAGKTHLCTAVSKYLLSQGHSVKYVLWHEFARKVQALKYRIDEYDAYIRNVADADVLYIDDLFKADKNTGAAFELINQRYMSRKPTIISSEMFISQIEQMDEAVGSRIEEMSKGFCVHIAAQPKRNYRKTNEG